MRKFFIVLISLYANIIFAQDSERKYYRTGLLYSESFIKDLTDSCSFYLDKNKQAPDTFLAKFPKQYANQISYAWRTYYFAQDPLFLNPLTQVYTKFLDSIPRPALDSLMSYINLPEKPAKEYYHCDHAKYTTCYLGRLKSHHPISDTKIVKSEGEAWQLAYNNKLNSIFDQQGNNKELDKLIQNALSEAYLLKKYNPILQQLARKTEQYDELYWLRMKNPNCAYCETEVSRNGIYKDFLEKEALSYTDLYEPVKLKWHLWIQAHVHYMTIGSWSETIQWKDVIHVKELEAIGIEPALLLFAILLVDKPLINASNFGKALSECPKNELSRLWLTDAIQDNNLDDAARLACFRALYGFDLRQLERKEKGYRRNSLDKKKAEYLALLPEHLQARGKKFIDYDMFK